MAKEAESGMAFEYALASSLGGHLGVDIEQTSYKEKSFQAFQRQTESTKESMRKAAFRAISFLAQNEHQLSMVGGYIKMQPSSSRDVRDIIVENGLGKTIGLSAKHHHYAVKHSRLSNKIDFGKEWMNIPCSPEYWQAIKPIFDDLKQRRQNKELWRDMPKETKHQHYYFPILKAFQSEMELIHKEHTDTAPKRLAQYLLGEYDFYKVIKESEKFVRVESFNFSGTLSWGRKMSIPYKFMHTEIAEGKFDTIRLNFNGEWVFSARLHNAESLIIPSLKFDIKIISWPAKIQTTTLNIDGQN